MDGLIIIPESDWKSFCEEWGGVQEKGISAEIELSKTEGNNLAGSCEEMPMCEEDLSTPNPVNGEVESRQLLIRTCPEVKTFFFLSFLVMHSGGNLFCLFVFKVEFVYIRSSNLWNLRICCLLVG